MKRKEISKTRQEIIHHNFEKYLKLRKMTQKSYAEKANVGKSTVSKWITNTGSNMSAEDIYQASLIFQINISDLYLTDIEKGQSRLIKQDDYKKIVAQKSKIIIMFAPTLRNYNVTLFSVSLIVLILSVIVQGFKLFETPYILLFSLPIVAFNLINKTNKINETFIINYIDEIYYRANEEQSLFYILRKIYALIPILSIILFIYTINKYDHLTNENLFVFYVLTILIFFFVSLFAYFGSRNKNVKEVYDYEIQELSSKVLTILVFLVIVSINFILIINYQTSLLITIFKVLVLCFLITDYILAYKWFKTLEAVYESDTETTKLYEK